jgi:hypothetical protein
VSFPLTVAATTFADPPALAAAVVADARAGGGTVVSGARPAAWLAAAVRDGALPRSLAVGLAAALIQHGEAASLVEAAELAVALDLRELGGLIGAALDAVDVGVLLARAPGDPATSVEDVLLRAWAALAPEGDPTGLRALLLRLRHAGLRAIELRVLLDHADPETIADLLPDVLAEDFTAADAAVVRAARARPGGDDAVGRALAALPPARRAAIGPLLDG